MNPARLLPDKLKQSLKPALKPLRRQLEKIQLRREYDADLRRYGRYMFASDSLVGSGLRGRQLEGQLTKDYHRVEKALTLPSPRRPFGAEVLARLRVFGPAGGGARYSEYVSTALDAATQWNDSGVISDVIAPISAPFLGLDAPDDFFGSRHSTRNFSSVSIPRELLDRAVMLAGSTPSVCNRQPWKVRFYGGVACQSLLRHQNGNSGFGNTVPAVALITVDSRLFSGPGERNQPWIEGGLFAMTLTWSLHSLGLSTCLLNMSLGNKEIKALRAEFEIPDYELVICQIAVGYGASQHRRARSPRRNVTEISEYIDL